MNSNSRQESTAQFKQKTSFNMNSREFDTISLENDFPNLINKEDSKANENQTQFSFSSNDSFEDLFNPKTMKMGNLKIKEKINYRMIPLATSIKQELQKPIKIKESVSERLLVQNLLDNTSVYSKPVIRRDKDNPFLIKEKWKNFNTNDETKDNSEAKKEIRIDTNSSKEIKELSGEKKQKKRNIRKSPINILKRRTMITRIQRWWKKLLNGGKIKDKDVTRIQSYWRGYNLRKKLYSYIFNYYIVEGFIFHVSHSIKRYFIRCLKSSHTNSIILNKKYLREKCILKFHSRKLYEEKERIKLMKYFKNWFIKAFMVEGIPKYSIKVIERLDKNKYLKILVKNILQKSGDILRKHLNKWFISVGISKIARGLLLLILEKGNNNLNIRKIRCLKSWHIKTYNISQKEREKRKSLKKLLTRLRTNYAKYLNRWRETNKKEILREEKRKIDLFLLILDKYLISKSFDKFSSFTNQFIKKKTIKPYCRSRIISVLKENDKTKIIMKYFHIWEKKSTILNLNENSKKRNDFKKHFTDFCNILVRKLIISSFNFSLSEIQSFCEIKVTFLKMMKTLNFIFNRIAFKKFKVGASKIAMEQAIEKVFNTSLLKQLKEQRKRTMICFVKWIHRVSSIRLKNISTGMVLQSLLKTDKIRKIQLSYFIKWFEMSQYIIKLEKPINIVNSSISKFWNKYKQREFLYQLSIYVNRFYKEKKMENVIKKYHLKGCLKKFKLICDNQFNQNYYICQENVKHIVRNTLFLIKEKHRVMKMLKTIKNRNKLVVKDQKNVLLKYFNMWNKTTIKMSFKGILIMKNFKYIIKRNLKKKMTMLNYFKIWKSNKMYRIISTDETNYKRYKLTNTIIKKIEENKKQLVLTKLRECLTKNFVLKRLNKIIRSNWIKPFIQNMKWSTKIQKLQDFLFLFSKLFYADFVKRIIEIKENTIKKKIVCPYHLKRTNIRITVNKPIDFIAYFHHWTKQVIKEKLMEINALNKQQNTTIREAEIKKFYLIIEREIGNNMKKLGLQNLLDYAIYKRKKRLIKGVINKLYFVRQFLKWKEVINTYYRFESIQDKISLFFKRKFFKDYKYFDKLKAKKKIILAGLKKHIILKYTKEKITILSFLLLWSKSAIKLANIEKALKKILRILLINKKINTIVIYFSEWLHKSNLMNIYYNSVQNGVLSLNFLYKKIVELKLKNHFFSLFSLKINRKKATEKIINMIRNNKLAFKQKLNHIRKYFKIWKNHNELSIKDYNNFIIKAKLYFKILARIMSGLHSKSVKTRFLKWKILTSELKKYVTLTVFFRNLSNTLKRHSQRAVFYSINNIVNLLKVEDLKDNFVKKIYSLRKNDLNYIALRKLHLWRNMNKTAKFYTNLAKIVILTSNRIKKDFIYDIKEMARSKTQSQNKKKVIKKMVVYQENRNLRELNEGVKNAFINWWKSTLRKNILSIRKKKVLKAVFKIKKENINKSSDFYFKTWKNRIFPLKSLLKVVKKKPLYLLNLISKIEKRSIINAFELIKEKSYSKIITKIKYNSSKILGKVLLNIIKSRNFFRIQTFYSKKFITNFILESLEKLQVRYCFNTIKRKFNILAEYMALHKNYHTRKIIGVLCKKYINTKQFYLIFWKNQAANISNMYRILVKNIFNIIEECTRKNKRKTLDLLGKYYITVINNMKNECLLNLYYNYERKFYNHVKIYFNRFNNFRKRVGKYNRTNTFRLDESFSDHDLDDFNIEINDLIVKKVEMIDIKNQKQRKKSIKKDKLDSTSASLVDQSESNKSKPLVNTFNSLIVNNSEDFFILRSEIRRVYRKGGYKSEVKEMNNELEYLPSEEIIINSGESSDKSNQKTLKNQRKEKDLNDVRESDATTSEEKTFNKNRCTKMLFEIYNKKLRKMNSFWLLYWKRLKQEYLKKIELIQQNYKKYRRGKQYKSAKINFFNNILTKKDKADKIRLKLYFTKLLNNTIHIIYHNYADKIKRFFKNNVKRAVYNEELDLEKIDKRRTLNLFTESFLREEKKKGKDYKIKELKKVQDDTFSQENFSFHFKDLDDDHHLSFSSFNNELENMKILTLKMKNMLLTRFIERKMRKEVKCLRETIKKWLTFNLEEVAKEKFPNNNINAKKNYIIKRFILHTIVRSIYDSKSLNELIYMINEKNKLKNIEIRENEIFEYIEAKDKSNSSINDTVNSWRNLIIKETLTHFKLRKMTNHIQRTTLRNLITFISNKLLNKQRKLIQSAKIKSNNNNPVHKVILIQKMIRKFFSRKRTEKIQELLFKMFKKADLINAFQIRSYILIWKKFYINNMLVQASNSIKFIMKKKLSQLRFKRKKAIFKVFNTMFISFLTFKILKPFFKKFVLKETLFRAGYSLSKYLLKYTLKNILYYSKLKNFKAKRNSILLKEDFYTSEILQNRFARNLRLNIAASEIQSRYRRHSILRKKSQGLERLKHFVNEDFPLKLFRNWKRKSRSTKLLSAAKTITKFVYRSIYLDIKMKIFFKKFLNRIFIRQLIQAFCKSKYKERLEKFNALINNLLGKKTFYNLKKSSLIKRFLLKFSKNVQNLYLQRELRVWNRVVKFEKRKELFVLKLSKFVKLNVKKNNFELLKSIKLISAIINFYFKCQLSKAFKNLKNYSNYVVTNYMLGNHLVEGESNIETSTLVFSLYKIYTYRILRKLLLILRKRCLKYLVFKARD